MQLSKSAQAVLEHRLNRPPAGVLSEAERSEIGRQVALAAEKASTPGGHFGMTAEEMLEQEDARHTGDPLAPTAGEAAEIAGLGAAEQVAQKAYAEASGAFISTGRELARALAAQARAGEFASQNRLAADDDGPTVRMCRSVRDSAEREMSELGDELHAASVALLAAQERAAANSRSRWEQARKAADAEARAARRAA